MFVCIGKKANKKSQNFLHLRILGTEEVIVKYNTWDAALHPEKSFTGP